MSQHFVCNECDKKIASLDRRIRLENLCMPYGIMVPQDFDFCNATCFWAFVRKWTKDKETRPNQ